MTKEKYYIDYTLRSISPQVLWNYISSANGLENWFADRVELSGKDLTFTWDKSSQKATQIGHRIGVFIRFRWEEDNMESNKPFFEFKISQMELTGNTVLTVTDYAYPDEKEDSIDLWNTQIENLRRKLGI